MAVGLAFEAYPVIDPRATLSAMTEDEAAVVYDIAWQAYLGIGALAEQLDKSGDTDGQPLGRQFARSLSDQLATATGRPLPAGVKHP